MDQFIVWVAAFCTIAAAVGYIIKAAKAAKAPSDKQNARLAALEAEVQTIKAKLENDNDRLESLDEGNRVTQRAILALLDHGIDGNNIEQMQHAKEALQNHLINR